LLKRFEAGGFRILNFIYTFSDSEFNRVFAYLFPAAVLPKEKLDQNLDAKVKISDRRHNGLQDEIAHYLRVLF